MLFQDRDMRNGFGIFILGICKYVLSYYKKGYPNSLVDINLFTCLKEPLKL